MTKDEKSRSHWASRRLDFTIRLMSSNRFFVFIIALTILQVMWYIFSVKMTIFDEGFHFEYISRYAERLNPFISEQNQQWDTLGEVTRDPSYLFYYVLSFPLRLIQQFADSTMSQVIMLRFMMLGFFLAALVLYRRLFHLIGISKLATNLSLLVLVLIPGITPLAGSINYDNVQFLFVPLLLLQATQIIKSRKVNSTKLILLITAGLVGTLMKFTLLPIFGIVIVSITAVLINRHRTKLLGLLRRSFRAEVAWKQIVLSIALFVSLGLFIERPVQNVMAYGNIRPSCQSIIGRDRCINNYTQRRNILAVENKNDELKPLNPAHYFFGLWLPGMLNTSSTAIYSKAPLPVIEMLSTVMLFGGSLVILLYFRDLWKNVYIRLPVIVSGGFLSVLIINHYRSYIWLGQPAAIAGRYLLPVLPIFLALVLSATAMAVSRRYAKTLLGVLATLAILLTQGGGMISTIIRADPSYYWERDGISDFNESFRETVDSVIIRKNSFRRI